MVARSLVPIDLAAPLASAKRPPEALALLPAALQPEVQRACDRLRLKMECLAAVDLFVSRVESGCPPLLLIDTDLLGWPLDLCKFARSLRPDVKMLGVTWRWSERDDVLAACVCGVLHKPPRRLEWEAVLERMGVPRIAPRPSRFRSHEEARWSSIDESATARGGAAWHGR